MEKPNKESMGLPARRWFKKGLISAVFLLTATMSMAAEIRVLCAGAYKAVLVDLADEFKKISGHTLAVESGTVGMLQQRMTQRHRAVFDVAIITPKAAQELTRDGWLMEQYQQDLAKVGIGVGVRAGAPKPDMSNAEAFKQLLLKVKSVAYIDPASGGTSGIYIDQLIDRMGVGEAVRSKAVLVRGGYAAQRVVDGQAEIAVQQMSEIMAVRGVDVAGHLPPELQSWTIYRAAIASEPVELDGSRQLIEFLNSDKARSVLQGKGMSAP